MSSSLNQRFTPWSLLKFAAPSIVMMVFMSLYTIVDGIFISRFVGSNALSATNIVLSGSQYRHCFCDHDCHRRQRNYQPLSRRRSSAKSQCLFDAICRHCPWIGRSHFHFGSDICHAALSVFGSQ